MARVPVFFISATSHDLGSYRETVAQALRDRELQVVVMSHFSPDYRQLREMLRQKMAPCDAVVCLIGLHYGAEPPGAARIRRSYTQWEYFIAREMKKPVYLFFAADEAPWDRPPSEPEDLGQLQLKFREHLVGTGQRRDYFSNKEQLRDLALRIPVPRTGALALWLGLAAMALAVGGVLVWTKPWKPPESTLVGPSTAGEKPPVSVTDASRADPFINSLKMRFIPLPERPPSGKLLSIWETRSSDWKASHLAGGTLGKPDEPVCGVNPAAAISFCLWLTQEERARGVIPADWAYRLPGVDEWTVATSTADGSNPIYPWGNDWSQAQVTANLRGNANGLPDDGYLELAPVGSFPANANGFHDLAGNVWEICTRRELGLSPVIRGGGWKNSQERVLRLDYHPAFSPESDYAKETGFRCLLAPGP